ncbi:MAG: Zn-dependent hydrolase [Bacteroidales bacterium]|nr:Zn-dependent hydrolase [Bacteroidales bacterium]
MRKLLLIATAAILVMLSACNPKTDMSKEIQSKVDAFVEVELTTDVSHLSEKEKQMLPLLFEAAQIIDGIFWSQGYGDKEEFFSEIEDDATLAFAKINYGPWERLKDNKPFIDGYGKKPLGANFYPTDMTREEFDAFESDNKTSLYTVIRRNANGSLVSIPYSEAYQEQHNKLAELIRKAAELAEDEGLKNYLNLKAEALLTDDYLASDMAWMDMKTNNIDFIIGPTENYEDMLFNYKTAHEAFILVKDIEWSQRLSHFAALLPELQESLPVAKQYKAEVPGSDSDLGVYDAIYYAGDCNAGSKTIAINLPNDPIVHVEKGSRKLQLKNSMQYRFDKIVVPISKIVIAEEQRKHVKFEAFFENTMFHEVAHGLGIKNTINNNGTVRQALKETYSPIEENKADILGLFMVTKLAEMGELGEKDLMDNYVTFMTGIFRSVRFGAASAHGKANMVRFYYFQEKGAFTRNPETGTYTVNFNKMTEAMHSLAEKTLVMQGDGNYQEAKKMLKEMGYIKDELQADLDRINKSNIPIDIVFKQGLEMLNL